MASHHPYHHHNHHQTTTTSTGCCCNNTCSHHPAPPPPPSTDTLLQTILSHLLLQQQQHQQKQSPQQPHYQHFSHNQTHKNHHFHQQNQSFQHRNRNFQHQEEYPQAKLVFSSLISRIDALETFLQNFSLSSATYNQYSSPFKSCSLRDVAARVIQTHFRAFLVRRSRTLRQLKELALIKSSFNSLKLSVSKKTHLDFHLVSRKAMDLLLELDSIQGDDPMIRDGKRSISVDLVKFLEFVEGFAVRRNEISCKGLKNVRLVRNDSNKSRFLRSNVGDSSKDQIDIMKKLRDRVERIHARVSKTEDEDVELEGFHQFIDDEEEQENPRVYRNKNVVLVKKHAVAQPKVKKSVSFAENGNVYRVFSNDNSHEPDSSGDGTLTDESVSSDDNGIILENICAEIEGSKGLSEVTEDGEEVYLEKLQSSDEERNTRKSLRSEDTDEIVGDYIGQDGQFLFSAPLPVKMESRADLMKRRKAVKIVT